MEGDLPYLGKDINVRFCLSFMEKRAKKGFENEKTGLYTHFDGPAIK